MDPRFIKIKKLKFFKKLFLRPYQTFFVVIITSHNHFREKYLNKIIRLLTCWMKYFNFIKINAFGGEGHLPYLVHRVFSFCFRLNLLFK